MKRIGIVLAMKEELESIRKYLKNERKISIFNLDFYDGYIYDTNCILVECGIGKVNAARTTQILIDNLKVDVIINIGVAGGITNELNVGDIVIGSKLVQHDFDITSFGHEKGFISGIGKYIDSDSKIISLVEEIAQKDDFKNTHILEGVIASGDIFCTDPTMAQKIHNKFDALCVEMEGASIAQVCYLCNVPFIVLRSISDTPNGNNEIDFETFLTESSNVISNLLLNVLETNRI